MIYALISEYIEPQALFTAVTLFPFCLVSSLSLLLLLFTHHYTDEWATLSGNSQWSYDEMLPYFQRLERVIRDEGAEPGPDRGIDGIIPVRHYNVSAVYAYLGILPALETYLNMTIHDQDVNSRDQSGISTLQVSREADGCWTDPLSGNELGCASNVRRGSSYNSFIRDPQLRQGELSNLEVVEGAKVVQIKDITPDNVDGEMEIQYIKTGWRYVVKARNEILMSAGTWGNPKIAMLSGIGPKDELEAAGIESIINLPGVGKHFLDHGVLWMTAMLNNVQPISMDMDNTGGTSTTMDLSEFSGVNNPLPALLADFNTIYMFFNSNETLQYPDMELILGTAPAGPTSALLITRLYQNKGTSGDGGTLTMRSNDPDEEMDVTRNFYADEESITPMLSSLRKVLAMIQSLTDQGPMILEPNAFTTDFDDDEAMKKYIRDNVVSEMHLQGSMKMGIPDEDPMAVVDGDLKVVGSNGRLRVADTAIFPTDMRGHPMATAMAVGMKAADLIASDYSGDTATVAADDGEVAAASDTVGDVSVNGDEGPTDETTAQEDMNGEGGPTDETDADLPSSSTRQGNGECLFAAAAATAAGCAFAAVSGSQL